MAYMYQRQSEVIVNNLADFPAPVGDTITLDSQTYVLASQIQSPYKFAIPTNGQVEIINDKPLVSLLTAGNALFNSADLGAGYLQIKDSTITCPVGGDIFNLSSSTAGAFVLISESQIVNCNSLGSVNGISFFSAISQYLDCGYGITLSNFSASSFFGGNFSSWKNNATSFITVSGTNGLLQFSGAIALPQSNEAVINITSSNFLGVVITTNPLSKVYGGRDFAIGSLDQTDPRVTVIGNSSMKDSTIKAELILKNNGLPTSIPAQNALININATTWTNANLERFSATSGGKATYSGIEDATIKVGSSVNLDPTTATKDLSTSIMLIDSVSHTATFDNTDNTIDSFAHGLQDNDLVSFLDSPGTLPAELRKDVFYYAINTQVAIDEFQVSYTSGGSAIAFTDNGTPTNNYSTVMLGSFDGLGTIGSGSPISLSAQSLFSIISGKKISLAVSNLTDAVNINVNSAYLQVTK